MKQIIKQTNGVAVIKVSGTNVTEKVTLSGDLVFGTSYNNSAPKVNISYAAWRISPDKQHTITVSRGGEPVLNLFQNTGELDLSCNGGFSDGTNNGDDFDIGIVGTGDLYLSVSKVQGYTQPDVVVYTDSSIPLNGYQWINN